MRTFIVFAAALAAVSCGGTSSNLSNDEAGSVADALVGALPSHESGNKLLTFGGSASVTRACAEGGSVSVSGSLSISCPSGFASCTTTGSLSIAADACTTSAGVVIDGTLSGTESSSGISFTETITGTLTVTPPGGTPQACAVNVTVSPWHVSGSICGTSFSR